MAQEDRNVIDGYLAGVSAEELELLDAATREAKRHLDAMATDLDRLNAKLDAAYSRISSVRAQSPVAGDKTGE